MSYYHIELPPVIADFERWEFVNVKSDLPYVGIYEITDDLGRVIYVGKSTRLANRLAEHIRSANFAHEIKRIRVREVAELQALDIFETHAINTFMPLYNRDKVCRDSSEEIAELTFAYTIACDDVEMYRDQIAELREDNPCILRDIDLQIAKDALLLARDKRKYLRQKLDRIR